MVCLATAMAVGAVAQAQTTFGVRGGVNLFNINGDGPSGADLENKLKVGFNAGVNAEIPIAEDFYLQPGVLFSQKGYKADGSDDKLNLSYVEVPVNLLYKPELGTGKLLLGFGPYFGVAADGSFKPDGNGDDIDLKFKNTVTPADLVSGQPYLRRYDAGGNLLVGYEFSNKLSFQLNAQLGMMNIAPKLEGQDEDAYGKYKNTGFGLSLGYRF